MEICIDGVKKGNKKDRCTVFFKCVYIIYIHCNKLQASSELTCQQCNKAHVTAVIYIYIFAVKTFLRQKSS